MANQNFRQREIPNKAQDGSPTRYYIVAEDGTHTPATRSECLAHDEQGAPPLRVDPDGASVTRMPRTPWGEELARENMQFNWNEDKRAERWTPRSVELEQVEQSASDLDVAQAAENKVLFDLLLSAAKTLLSPEDHYLFHAAFLEGKTEREIAPVLGLKEPKSVNYRKKKILRILRTHLGITALGEDS